MVQKNCLYLQQICIEGKNLNLNEEQCDCINLFASFLSQPSENVFILHSNKWSITFCVTRLHLIQQMTFINRAVVFLQPSQRNYISYTNQSVKEF